MTDWRHYIVAEGQTVAIVSRKSTGTNAVNYPLEDSQGSGSTLTNSSGSLLVRESFNAFGLPRDGSDWDGAASSGDLTIIEGISRRGYTGHSMLGRMGLIHMNGRVQDAITGRFLSPDPTIPDAAFTQSYNRYAYVNNNPMSYTDPSGFRPDLVSGTNMTREQFTSFYENLASMYGYYCGSGEVSSAACSHMGQDYSYYAGLYGGMMAETYAADHAARAMASFYNVWVVVPPEQQADEASRPSAAQREAAKRMSKHPHISFSVNSDGSLSSNLIRVTWDNRSFSRSAAQAYVDGIQAAYARAGVYLDMRLTHAAENHTELLPVSWTPP